MEDPIPRDITEWKAISSDHMGRMYHGKNGQVVREEYAPNFGSSIFVEKYLSAYRRIGLNQIYDIKNGATLTSDRVSIYTSNPDMISRSVLKIDTVSDFITIGIAPIDRDENGVLSPDEDTVSINYDANGLVMSADITDVKHHSLSPTMEGSRDEEPSRQLQDLFVLVQGSDQEELGYSAVAIEDILDEVISRKYTKDSGIVALSKSYAENLLENLIKRSYPDIQKQEEVRKSMGILKNQLQIQILEKARKDDFNGEFLKTDVDSSGVDEYFTDDLRFVFWSEINNLAPVSFAKNTLNISSFGPEGIEWTNYSDSFTSGFANHSDENKVHGNGFALYDQPIQIGDSTYLVHNVEDDNIIRIIGRMSKTSPLKVTIMPKKLDIEQSLMNATLDPDVRTPLDYLRKVGFDKDFDIRQLSGLFDVSLIPIEI